MKGRGLPFELFLGLRYLRARGHRANLSLFVWIGVGGVFLGVSALIVVLAVMTGFQDGIRDKIIAANPHILVVETGGRGVADAAALAAGLDPIKGVRSATPFVLQQALFTARRRRHRRPPARRGPGLALGAPGARGGDQARQPRPVAPAGRRAGAPARAGAGPEPGRRAGRSRDPDLAPGRDDGGGARPQDAAVRGGGPRRGRHVRVRLLARLHGARRRPGVRRARATA